MSTQSKRKGFCVAVVCVASVLGGASAAPSASGPSGYHLIKTIPVPGDTFWDYLRFEPASRRLFVSHGTHVVVVDVDGGQVVGDIPDTPTVHGIDFAPELNRGFITSGQGKLIIFDLKTLAVVGSAPADEDCDGLVYDATSKRVFTMNGDSKSSTVVDARTGKVVARIDLGGGPEFPVADGKGHVYANIETTSEIVEIDAQSLKILHRWPLAPAKTPSGLAMDTVHRLLFSGCRNQRMAIVNADTGKIVATPTIGPGVDATRFDPGTQDAFSSNGGDGGTLTVIHEDSPTTFHVVEHVSTEAGARTMALDPKTHEVFLATATLERIPNPPPHTRPFKLVPGTFHVLVFGK